MLDDHALRWLNSHGHAFQAAICKIARRLTDDGTAAWNYESEEFPVECAGAGTSIDLVLTRDRYVMLVEAKRVSKDSHWAFFRSARMVDPDFKDGLFVEQVFLSPDHVAAQGGVAYRLIPHRVFDICTNLSDKDGPLSSAISQSLRGMNGFVNHLLRTYQRTGEPHRISIISVIVTTASLYGSQLPIADADLANGNLRADQIKLEPLDRAYFQCPGSADLKHTASVLTLRPKELLAMHLGNVSPGGLDRLHLDIDRVSRLDFTRTIVFVPAEGFEAFVRTFMKSSS